MHGSPARCTGGGATLASERYPPHCRRQANRLLENIGARRLFTVLERILAELSFSAPELALGGNAHEALIDENMVHAKLDGLLKQKDLSRYVL
jgi:ATP-dependent HslUV protease ATP-binding subunit HslU